MKPVINYVSFVCFAHLCLGIQFVSCFETGSLHHVTLLEPTINTRLALNLDIYFHVCHHTQPQNMFLSVKKKSNKELVGDMAQQVKVLVTRPDNLSLIPAPTWQKEPN